jgi:hypothetical protein
MMKILNIVAAGAGAWIFGAVWYMALSKPRMAASGVAVGPTGARRIRPTRCRMSLRSRWPWWWPE